MVSLKDLAKINKVLFSTWGLLVSIAILNLFNFSFISDKIQYIYYGIYFIVTFIVFIYINKKSEFRINQLLIALITLSTLIISIKSVFLTLPILLIYPFLSSDKSHTASMVLAAFSYFVTILGIMIILFIQLGFSFGVDTLIEKNKSQNSKYELSMHLIDLGATGGNTLIYLDKLYLNAFKHRKQVFVGPFGAENKLTWIDDKTFKIDEHIIDVNTKETIWKRK